MAWAVAAARAAAQFGGADDLLEFRVAGDQAGVRRLVATALPEDAGTQGHLATCRRTRGREPGVPGDHPKLACRVARERDAGVLPEFGGAGLSVARSAGRMTTGEDWTGTTWGSRRNGMHNTAKWAALQAEVFGATLQGCIASPAPGKRSTQTTSLSRASKSMAPGTARPRDWPVRTNQLGLAWYSGHRFHRRAVFVSWVKVFMAHPATY